MHTSAKRTILFIAFIILAFVAQAQEAMDELKASFGVGNVGGIVRFCGNNISLNIVGSQANYSRSQAEMILRDFFNKNAPKKFDIEHTGSSANMKFSIGTLYTSTGNYKTYFSVRYKDGSYYIQEIRIERN